MRPFSTLAIASTLFVAAAVSATHLTGCSSSAAKKTCTDDGANSALSKCTPIQNAAKGIEVSSANGDIDWTQVRSQGYSYGVARVSYGTTKDKKFAKNWVHMKDAGIVRAPAHYFIASLDAKKQADTFMTNLDLDWWDLGFKYGKLTAGDLPAVLYIEDDDGVSADKVVSGAQTWLDFVEAKTKIRPIVLTTSKMSKVLKTALKDYPLWYADYPETMTDCPTVPDSWASWQWSFWSRGEEDQIKGVPTGPVATGIFNGPLNELRQMTFPGTPVKPTQDAGPPLFADAGGAQHDAGSSADAGQPGADAGTSSGSTTPPEPPPDQGSSSTPPETSRPKSTSKSSSEEDKSDPCAPADPSADDKGTK
jgi:GH25 family lysozyme M1 (1,4-beta-N-acetylmuramidase)